MNLQFFGGRGSSIGGRGYIDATPEAIISAIQKDNDSGVYYGLRSTDDNRLVGSNLRRSVDWDQSSQDERGNYGQEKYKLNGSSTIGIGDKYDAESADISSILQTAQKYPGSNLYLVKGKMTGYGSDPGEVIISANGRDLGATVLAKIRPRENR